MTNNAKQPGDATPQPKPQPLLQPLAKKQETVSTKAKKQETRPLAKKERVRVASSLLAPAYRIVTDGGAAGALGVTQMRP